MLRGCSPGKGKFRGPLESVDAGVRLWGVPTTDGGPDLFNDGTFGRDALRRWRVLMGNFVLNLHVRIPQPGSLSTDRHVEQTGTG